MAENDKPPSTVTPLATRLLSRREVFSGVGIILLCVLAFGVIARGYPTGRYRAFDETVLRAFRTDGDSAIPRGPWWGQPGMRGITLLGHGVVLTIVALGGAGCLYFNRRRRAAATVVFSSVGGSILDLTIKSIADRPRPTIVPHLTEVMTSSFPSGHALLSTIIYLSVGMMIAQSRGKPRSGFLAIACAVLLTSLIGISRIYLGVHYPTDVVAGWAAGLGWTLLCILVEASGRPSGEVPTGT